MAGQEIASKGPIRVPIESGVSDAPKSSPKVQVQIEPGGPQAWISDTSIGRFVDADQVGSSAPDADSDISGAAFHDRIMGLIPPDILARAAMIKIERRKRQQDGF